MHELQRLAIKRVRVNTFVLVTRCKRNLGARTLRTYKKSTCFIAIVVGMWANHTQTLLSTESMKSNCQRSLIYSFSPVNHFVLQFFLVVVLRSVSFPTEKLSTEVRDDFMF